VYSGGGDTKGGGAIPPANVKSLDPGRDRAISVVRGRSSRSGADLLSGVLIGIKASSDKSASLATRRRDRFRSSPPAASRLLPR
jgi:hypothetical protein